MFIKNKVIVKLVKGKDSKELCLLKKGYCETFKTQRFHRNIFTKKKDIVKLFNLKIPTNVLIRKKDYCETF